MRTLRCFWELTFPVKNIFTINVLFDVKYRYNIDDDPMYMERTRLPEPPVSQPKKKRLRQLRFITFLRRTAYESLQISVTVHGKRHSFPVC